MEGVSTLPAQRLARERDGFASAASRSRPVPVCDPRRPATAGARYRPPVGPREPGFVAIEGGKCQLQRVPYTPLQKGNTQRYPAG